MIHERAWTLTSVFQGNSCSEWGDFSGELRNFPALVDFRWVVYLQFFVQYLKKKFNTTEMGQEWSPPPCFFNTESERGEKKEWTALQGGSWQSSKCCGLWPLVECQHQTYCGLCSLANPCCESSCTCTWGPGCLWNQGWSFSLADSGISLEVSLKRDDTSK